MSSYLALDEIVKSYLLRRGDNTTHNYARFLAYGIDGLKELRYDVGGASSIKTVELDINPNTNTVILPHDFVNYTKIGTCENGNFVTLGLNEQICTITHFDDCGNPIPLSGGNLGGLDTNFDVNGFTDGYFFYNYGNYGRVYGHGGGYNRKGYYKFDLQNNRILFNSEIRASSIILEYVSNGYEPGIQTLVHPFFNEPLIAWIRWKDIQYKPSVGQGEKESAKREYALARRQLQLRNTSFTLDEFIQASRRNYKRTIKN